MTVKDVAELPPLEPPTIEIAPPVETAAAAVAVAAPTPVIPVKVTVAQTVPPPLQLQRRPVAPVPAPIRKSKKKKVLSPGQQQGNSGENTGRWTAEEHRLFLQGLEQHGKGWKKIASLIKSRTVVQIRTHAQKYFQKLAKARQNGEEGDVTMEGRGGVASVTSAEINPTPKRRRHQVGTKRKAIQSVISSAQRQGKKLATTASANVPNPIAPLPAIAPALAHFVLPSAASSASMAAHDDGIPAPGTVSGLELEDSYFRFLTPCPLGASISTASTDPQVNDVARQAGANPITLPTTDSVPTNSGEASPTGVADLSIYPSWTDAKETPSWYAKGADVEALLDVADTLDWLADSGDVNETYQPPSLENIKSNSVSTLPRVESNMEAMVPSLPSLFQSSDHFEDVVVNSSMDDVGKVAGDVVVGTDPDDDDDGLNLFDSPMEEHAFVTTILEQDEVDGSGLPPLEG